MESGVVGTNHADLIEQLYSKQLITDEIVRETMLKVDRGDFCAFQPYKDCDQSIGHKAVIPAPYMHACALKNLKDHLKEGCKVLDVGSGSGYLTVCMALMVGEKGKVTGVDNVPELVALSTENIRKNHNDLLTSGRIVMETGNGSEWTSSELYDVIHAGIPSYGIPVPLIELLAFGGRMLINLGDLRTYAQIDIFEDGSLHVRRLSDILYDTMKTFTEYEDDSETELSEMMDSWNEDFTDIFNISFQNEEENDEEAVHTDHEINYYVQEEIMDDFIWDC